MFRLVPPLVSIAIIFCFWGNHSLVNAAVPTAPKPGQPLALPAGGVDMMVFGAEQSEKAHGLSAADSDALKGALGEPARRLLPKNPVDKFGGEVTFTMAVDPVQRNYFTVKLWGEDDTDYEMGRLYLYVRVDGVDYQVGYRHEGDYTPLNVAARKPPLPGRFFYSTTLLPLPMTQGKTSLTLKIVSTGRFMPYGKNWATYHHDMNVNGRGIYRAYTHTQPLLAPVNEVQGMAPTTTVCPSPGEEVLAKGGAFVTGINERLQNRINSRASVGGFIPRDVEFLARSYSVPGLIGYHNKAVVDQVIALLDLYAADYAAHPTEDYWRNHPGVSGMEWGGRNGYLGYAIHQLIDQLKPVLHQKAAGSNKSRCEAWGDMLAASRDFGRTHRRAITNQAMIADTSVYLANKGLLDLGDPRAFKEADAQRYLREAVGLTPFLGNDLPNGDHEALYGHNVLMVSHKGLVGEWGYDGFSYGEMAQHAATMYEMTGNPEFRDQAAKMIKARAPFRRPSSDITGTDHYHTMVAIGYLSWRGVYESDGDGFSTEPVYGDRSSFNLGMHVAAVTLDPTVVGYAKQMLADNQYFKSLTAGKLAQADDVALAVFADYQKVKAAPDSGARLPMTEGQPDFTWADEEIGVLAIKHGTDRLWIAPYWEAKNGGGINGIARFHYSTPQYDQLGTMETVPQFTASGICVRRPDTLDRPEANNFRLPNAPKQAYGGEKVPIGFVPPDVKSSEPYRGKADFYAFRLGNYLIGMNRTSDRSYELKTPAGFASAPELFSGKTVSGPVSVPPNSTIALFLDSAFDTAPIPITPLALTVTHQSNGNTLEWSPSSGATSYTVKRASAANGPFFRVKSAITGTTYTDVDAASIPSACYTVTAVNAHGESYESMKAQAVSVAQSSSTIR
jgi:hypothetical protein